MEGRELDGKFKKGSSGNPGGRPKIKKDYRALLDAVCSNTAWRAIIRKAVVDAKEGDWRARQWLSGYGWGQPTQAVKVTGNLGFTLADWEQRAEQRLREFMEGDREDSSISEQSECESV